jgi:hypothetical protein
MPVQRFNEVIKEFRHSPPTRLEPRRGPRPYQSPPGRVALRYCGFCGCAEDELPLVAGRSAHICVECLLLACEAVIDSGSVIPADRLRRWLGVWKRIGMWLLRQKGELPLPPEGG